MAERILVVAQLTTVGGSARDELLDRFEKLSEIALQSEPGLLKYAVLIPREDDGKTVYAVEEYLDQATFEEHVATDGVKALMQLLSDGTILDPSTSPTIHTLEYLPNFRFSREEVLTHPDPHVVFCALDYIPGGVETSIPYWKAVVETGRDHEPGTLVYGILKDPKNEKRLCAFETYESPEYLMDVHVPSKAIQDSIGNTKHLRTGLKHHFMKMKGGFLHRKP